MRCAPESSMQTRAASQSFLDTYTSQADSGAKLPTVGWNPDPLTRVRQAAMWALVRAGPHISGVHPSNARQRIGFPVGWSATLESSELEAKGTRQLLTSSSGVVPIK
jgi:hypothetical protein